jgi:hypothetical protein
VPLYLHLLLLLYQLQCPAHFPYLVAAANPGMTEASFNSSLGLQPKTLLHCLNHPTLPCPVQLPSCHYRC